jgi:hypothetical protein
MSMRVCAQHGCPTIFDAAEGTRCDEHRKEADKARGRRQARGYDRNHDTLRQQWAPRVATGTIRCARCGQLITAGDPWALDHTDLRDGYLGPSHARCNNSAGGKASHR